MPSKKKKYNARFPAGRIKKIMQSDEEVGKVAQAVPVIISRTLELFVESLLKKTVEITNARNAKTLSPSHLKQCILSEKRFDFLSDLVKNIPDAVNEEESLPNEVTNSSCSSSSVSRRRTSAETRPSNAKTNSASSSNSCASSSLVSSSSSTHTRLSHVPQPAFQVSSSTPSPSGGSYTTHLNHHSSTAPRPQPGHNFSVSQHQQSHNNFSLSQHRQSHNSFTVSHQQQSHTSYSVSQPSNSPAVSQVDHNPSLSHLNHHNPSPYHNIHSSNSSYPNNNPNHSHNMNPSQPSQNITISAPNFSISIPSVQNNQYIPHQLSYTPHTITYPQSHETQSSQSGNSGSGFQLNVCPSASVPNTATFNNMVPSYAPAPVSNLVIDEDYDN